MATPSDYIELSAEQKETKQRLDQYEADLLKEVSAFKLRWASIAKTHFQEGFMALRRALIKGDAD